MQAFGDLRQVYTAVKHRGFVMITFDDLRAAVRAKETLYGSCPAGVSNQGLPLEIYYAVPKGDQTVSQVRGQQAST